jgi:drug/metabolite transporter (DMT)-like permease
MVVAVVAALAAGACFAIGGVLQQRAASTRPEGESLSFRLIVDLATEPMWLLGIGLAVCSYGLEALALSFGPLVLVQPLIVTELLFALPVSIRWAGSHMTRRDWLGTLFVGGSLSLGLASAAPGAGRAAAPVGQWAVALGTVAGLAALAVLAGRHERGTVARPSLYALAAALVLGCQAALLKATIPRFELGFVPAIESWETWAMAAAAIIGLLLVQSAYQSGPLAATMPVVDAVEPAVAIAFGVVLFHEHIRTGPYLVGVLLGMLGLLAGIWLLDTSPTVQCLQRWQNRSGTSVASGS